MTSNDDFLPGEPEGSSRYLNMKALKSMKDRTARIRILSPFVTGYVKFGADKKPRRIREGESFAEDVAWGPGLDGKEQVARRFWACAVYNHNLGAEQVWEFHQGSIHGQLKALIVDDDWGIPTGYDIKLKSTGEGMDTVYTVLPVGKAPLPPAVLASWTALKESWWGLPALYEGGDPFAPASEAAVPF